MTAVVVGLASYFCPRSRLSSLSRCSETAFSSRFYFPMPVVELCNVEKLHQFAEMRDDQTGLNSQRIQREVTAINSANLESKTRSADNVETV
jgi:hypothetical protein